MDAIGAAIHALSPSGRRARLSIFVFHRVLPSPDPIFPEELDAARFEERMRWIRMWFNVLPLDDAIRHLGAAKLPARAACVTFDDGYADNFTVALPILGNAGISATFFIATGYIENGCMWNDRIIAAIRACSRRSLDLSGVGLGRYGLDSPADRRRAIDALLGGVKYLPSAERARIADHVAEAASVVAPPDLMMTRSQLRGLRAAGMQIGAHTASHPILTRLPLEEARREAKASKAWLEDTLQEPVDLFAYPNGKPGIDYGLEHAIAMRELGFTAACSTGWGVADHSTDVKQLPRITPWDQSRSKFGARLVQNLLRRPNVCRNSMS
jgi:peptidoglycan/xylan/chitin deacetylase (PgdA/CDA1 family)